MLIVVLDGNIDVTHGDEYFAASKGEAFVYPKSLSVVMRSAAPFATLELEFGGGGLGWKWYRRRVSGGFLGRSQL